MPGSSKTPALPRFQPLGQIPPRPIQIRGGAGRPALSHCRCSGTLCPCRCSPVRDAGAQASFSPGSVLNQTPPFSPQQDQQFYRHLVGELRIFFILEYSFQDIFLIYLAVFCLSLHPAVGIFS